MIIDNPNLFIAKIALIQDHKKYGLTLNIQLSYTKDTYNTYSSWNYMSIFFFNYMHQPINHAQIQRAFLVVLGIPLFGLPDFGLVEGLLK